MAQSAITAQTQLDVVPLGQDASTNVCDGAPFTSFTGNIVCDGSGVVCPGSQTDVNSCGACGNVCPSGDSCIQDVCTGTD